MTEIRARKFQPHPLEVAGTFDPVVRPNVAFDVTTQFQNELDVLLNSMCNSRAVSREAIVQYARQQYIDNNTDDDLAQVVLYHLCHEQYVYSGNADNIWSDRTQYSRLVMYPSIQLVYSWSVSSMFRQANQFLQGNSPDMMQLERRTDPRFLFERNSLERIEYGGEVQTSENMFLVGQVANLTQQVSVMAQNIQALMQRLGPPMSMTMPVAPEEPAYPVAEDVQPGSVDPTEMSLEQLARKIHEFNTNNAPMRRLDYSTFWTSPPPVSLTTLYSMNNVTPASKTFLVDSFLDIYNSQMSLLSIHFYLRRMAALWQHSDDIIESALFSSEMTFLKNSFSMFIEKINHNFAIKFLAMEGINLTGAKNVDALKSMFPAPGRSQNIKPIIDVENYLGDVVDTVRDCCVALERLRVSLLYGRDHPSYVGDDFLASYLYRSYITRHAGSSLETIMAVMPTLANMTLPDDQKRNVSFFNDLFGQSVDSAESRFVLEPEMRRSFDDRVVNLIGGTHSSGKSHSMPVTGELKSLFPSTHEGSLLITLVEKMWSESAYIIVGVTPDENVEDAVQERAVNEPLIPED